MNSTKNIIQRASAGGDWTHGHVKWFDNQRGYGFIVPDDGGPDVFVHASTLRRGSCMPAEEGQAVEYVARRGERGDSATEVRPCCCRLSLSRHEQGTTPQ